MQLIIWDLNPWLQSQYSSHQTSQDVNQTSANSQVALVGESGDKGLIPGLTTT